MSGQLNNRYGDRGRMPTITEGVTAPTTATAGQLGDVRIDTNGVFHRLSKIVGSVYTWMQIYPECSANLVLAADQTTNLTAGNKIAFVKQGNTCPFTINVNGSVVLPAGEYDVTKAVRPTSSGSTGLISVGLFETDGSEIGITRSAVYEMANPVTTAFSQPITTDRIVLTEETTIEAQITTATAITNLLKQGTYMTIRRIS